jgi:pyruvate/2-oxoglutarate dehydrogenase complex dihydrolipoamide acyltransferase (E2) component
MFSDSRAIVGAHTIEIVLVKQGENIMRRHFFAAGLAGGALALAISFGGAATASAAAPQAAREAQAQPPTPTPSQPGAPKARGQGHGKSSLISAAASVTGLTADQVVTELRSGKSLAQIAQGKGKTADEIIKAARAEYQSALSQSVTSGRLTQAQADARLAEFDQSAPQIVNDTTLGQRAGRGCARDGATGTSGVSRRGRAARGDI